MRERNTKGLKWEIKLINKWDENFFKKLKFGQNSAWGAKSGTSEKHYRLKWIKD